MAHFKPDFIITSDFVVSLREELDKVPGSIFAGIYCTRRLLPSSVSPKSIQLLLDSIDLVLSIRNAPLIITLLETDLYRQSLYQTNRLSNADYFIGFGSQFTPLYDTVMQSYAEIKPMQDSITSHGFDFSISNSHRTITILDFVQDTTRYCSPLLERKSKWSVPGVAYAARQSAIESLQASNIQVQYGRSFSDVSFVIYSLCCAPLCPASL